MKKKILILCIFLVLLVVFSYFLLHKKEDTNKLKEATTKNFEAEIYLYTREEGGRITPIYEGFRPQIRFTNSGQEIGSVLTSFKEEKIIPGNSERVHIELYFPMALKLNDEFLIVETPRIVGKGTIYSLEKN